VKCFYVVLALARFIYLFLKKHMDSINRQQEEENRKDLSNIEAIEKIRELVNASKTCFFCTRASMSGPLATRPMAVQKVDDEGMLWFLSATDSHKNAEIAIDPTVQLFFQGNDYSEFLTLTGKAVITTNKGMIKALWKPILKVWFTDGVDDPRISVIAFTPQEGYYWDNKNGNVVAFIKQIAGAAMGKTLDDSIEGTIKI
jgi:general stress protein 26